MMVRCGRRRYCGRAQLFEPTASSGPAAMVLAISRNLSCIPRRSPCPGRYPLPLASVFLSTFRNQQYPPTESLPGPISSSSGVRQSPYPARCILRIRHTSLTTVSTLAPITTTIIRITQYNKAPFFDGSPNTHNTILLITESPITSKA